MIVGPPPAAGEGGAADEDAARWTEAKQLRSTYARWLIIWVARTDHFHGYPLARSRAGATLTAETIDGLAAKISQAEQAASRPRGRSAGPPGTPGTPGPPGPPGTPQAQGENVNVRK